MTTPVKTSPIAKRIYANPISKGNIGKSFLTDLVVSWLDARKVTWSGSDLDDRHKTFSAKYPQEVQLYKVGEDRDSKEAFQTIFRRVLQDENAVHVIDTRAQIDEVFVGALEDNDFLGLCQEEGMRMTLFMFPTDEVASMKNFVQLIQSTAGMVDFVIVDNPAKSKGKLFYGSDLEATLQRLGAEALRIPIINYSTSRIMEVSEIKAKRGIPLAEFASRESGHLDILMVREIQSALATMYAQFDKIADVLLPDDLSVAIKSLVPHQPSKRNMLEKDEGFQLNLSN